MADEALSHLLLSREHGGSHKVQSLLARTRSSYVGFRFASLLFGEPIGTVTEEGVRVAIPADALTLRELIEGAISSESLARAGKSPSTAPAVTDSASHTDEPIYVKESADIFVTNEAIYLSAAIIEQCYLSGRIIQWSLIYAPQSYAHRKIPLSTYPYERERFWFD